MAYHKRTIKDGSIQIDGCDITVAEIEDNISVVWIQAWYRQNQQCHPVIRFSLDDYKAGITPLYVKTKDEIIRVGSGRLPSSKCYVAQYRLTAKCGRWARSISND